MAAAKAILRPAQILESQRILGALQIRHEDWLAIKTMGEGVFKRNSTRNANRPRGEGMARQPQSFF